MRLTDDERDLLAGWDDGSYFCEREVPGGDPDANICGACTPENHADLYATVERIKADAYVAGIRKAIYEGALWCGECDPADPDDDCCVVVPLIRAALTAAVGERA